jgi:hypothetical protein
VITRDEESFQAWLGSESFAHGHRSAAEGPGRLGPTAGRAAQRGVVLHRGRRIRSPLSFEDLFGPAGRGSVNEQLVKLDVRPAGAAS